MASPSKSCGSDPIPTMLLTEILPSVIDFITPIVNQSLQEGDMPDNTKESLIKSLCKKANLDLPDKKFWPVCNPSFISKLIEKCAASNIVTYAEEKNLMDLNQSAYHQHFNTETSVLRICAYILKAMDKQGITCLILLDLLAAFDTNDYEILLRRLEKRFSIKGNANKWIESYLTNWYQCVIIGDVKINGATIGPIRVTQGIPQGLVLGPILFILYTSSLGDLCRSHGLSYQLFADDQKIYILFKPGKIGMQSQCISHLEACIEDTRSWININLLKLNDDKMELIILDTRQQLAKVNEISIKVGNAVVKPVPNDRDLGFFLDCLLKKISHQQDLWQTV